jgi:hypothetical protein
MVWAATRAAISEEKAMNAFKITKLLAPSREGTSDKSVLRTLAQTGTLYKEYPAWTVLN